MSLETSSLSDRCTQRYPRLHHLGSGPVTLGMNRTVKIALNAATAALLAAPTAWAAPTDPDLGFGQGGRVTVDAGERETAYDVALQPDGKAVGVGLTGSNTDALAFRVGAGGRDRSFDGDGIRPLNLTGVEIATGVAIQPDGKIVVAGQTSLSSDAAVWRLNPDGSPDNSFHNDGIRNLTFGGVEALTDVAIQPDGKIVVAGQTNIEQNAAVWRLNPDGTPDNSFDNDGRRAINSGGVETGQALALQPDGKIVVAGSAGDDGAVYRLNADGSLDNGFDGDGARGVGSPAQIENLFDVAIQPDGKIVVSGRTFNGDNVLVARLGADGTPDPAFGVGGERAVANPGNDLAFAIAVQPDGKLLIAGRSSNDGLLLRLNADGTSDETFAPGGVFELTSLVTANAIARQADGKIVVAGEDRSTPSDAAVHRLVGDSRPSTGNPPSTGSPQAGRDTLAPALSRLGLSRKRIPANRGRTTLSFDSSEAARLSIRFDRVGSGRPARRAGSLTRHISAGRGRVRLSTRLGRRRLAPGRYRLTLVARDAAGNSSKPKRLLLQIKRAAGHHKN